MLGRISLLESERRYEEALTLFDEFRELEPVRNGRFGELDIMEEMLSTAFEDQERLAQVEICAYDAIGKRVAILIHGSLPAGRHRTVLKASELPSGVYFIRAIVELEGAPAQTFVSKVVLAR